MNRWLGRRFIARSAWTEWNKYELNLFDIVFGLAEDMLHKLDELYRLVSSEYVCKTDHEAIENQTII